ncbi:MAG: sugar ABC transporter ATP-binding protein [Hyphomicrobiales bacterium]
MNATIHAIALHDIRKAFGATVAVDGASFSIDKGSVHALLGENGAGKSTVVKLLSGLMLPDSGKITIDGAEARLDSARAAHRHGIQTAFQEMTLVRDLTVLENILLNYAPVNALGLVERRRAEAKVAAHFDALGLTGVNLRDEIRDIELAVKQKIEIARALYREPKILLLDEPTSSLSGRDVDWLGDIIARERAKGVTVVFISHRLHEVRTFCDHMTVLRNGRHIATASVSEVPDAEVIRMIVGRSIGQAFPPKPTEKRTRGKVVLGARDISAGRARNITFDLHEGEILGIAGLQGMGQLSLFLSCFGMAEIEKGHIEVDGQPVVMTTPADAISAAIGISMMPEDRKTEALFLKLSGKHNASIPVISRFSRMGLIDGRKETEAVGEVFRRVDVDERALWTRAGAFSGGNQQKIALAKWLLAESRALLLYDPTRGIDVGTKHEIYQLMRSFAEAGGAVLFYSTEIPELVHLADRVLVLYQGSVVDAVEGDRLDEETIVQATLGGHTSASAGQAA